MLKISPRYSVLSNAFRGGSQLFFRDTVQTLGGPLRSVPLLRPFMTSHLNCIFKDAQSMRESNILNRTRDGKGIGNDGTVWNGYGVLQMRSGLYEGHFQDGQFHGEGKITFPNGTTLAGEFKEGFIWNGSGIQRESDGNVYEGAFQEGKRSGPTKITYADGSVFEATMKDGQLWDGTGKIKLKPGIYYVGGIRDGILHGKGKINYTNNGTYLEGEFRWGKLWNAELRNIPNAAADGSDQGEQDDKDGVLRRWVKGRQVGGNVGASASDELDSLDSVHAERVVQKDGSVLEGEWRGDTFFGKQTSTDGKIMTGEFRNGQIWTGEGEMYLKNGALYEGAVQRGRLHGQAKVTHPDGRSQVGQFTSKGWLWNGSGALRLQSGDIYQGEIREGRFSGMGKLTFAGDSNVLEGEFRNGRLWDGVGTLRHPDGSIYQGEFKEGQRHGQGRLTYADGGFHEGEFREGKLWEGAGMVRIAIGEVYQGEIKEGKFNGQGLLSLVGEVLRGEFKDGSIWSGQRVMRDGRVTQRWREGTSDGSAASAAPAMASDASNRTSSSISPTEAPTLRKATARVEGVQDGNSEDRLVASQEATIENKIMLDDEIVSELSLEALWSKVKKLRGGSAGADQIGKNGDQIFTTPGMNETESFYNQASETDATSQVTFPDTRLNANKNVPEVGTKAPVSEASKSKVNRQKATKKEKDLQASEGATHTSRGRKSHWMDLHPDAHAIPVAVTAADVLASRCRRFVTADNTVIEGEWRGEKFIGKQTFADGRAVEGVFVNHQLHGQGKITYSDGRSLVGLFKRGQLWDGLGVLELDSGDSYVGEMAKGRMHGQGKLIYPDGGSFEGEFRNGQAWTGSGTKCLRDGASIHKLTGEFKDGRLWNGVGYLKFKAGGCYEGEFKEGNMHGQGTMTLRDGRLQVGEFKEGSFIDSIN